MSAVPRVATSPSSRRVRHPLGLDRAPGALAPLDPGAVIHPDVGVAERIFERKPDLAGAVANRAVGHHSPARADATGLAQRTDFVAGAQHAVLVAHQIARDAHRSGNMPGPSAVLRRARRPE